MRIRCETVELCTRVELVGALVGELTEVLEHIFICLTDVPSVSAGSVAAPSVVPLVLH